MSEPPVVEWRAPQEKYIRWIVNTLVGGALLFGGALIVTKMIPTVTDAVTLLTVLTENLIYLALTVAGFVALGWLLVEIFSPNGRINKLFAQAYNSMIRAATMELLNVDPITPLTESLKAVVQKKRTYDEQFAQFDGQIQVLRGEEDRFLTSAKKSETQGKAALKINDKAAMDRALYKAGSDKEAAASFAKMIANLERVRSVIVRLQGAANDIIYKLEVDIDRTQSEWKAAQNMTKMDGAARSILEGAGKNELAKQAQALVQSKYAASIGRLNNLETAAAPLLESMDLDKATYSQEFLDKWEAEERADTVAIPMQASIVMPMITGATDKVPATKGGFGGLIE